MNVADKLSKPGAIGVIPTDTVYGLVARAHDREAVARIYALKSREHKPGTIIAASIDQLVELGIKRRYLNAVSEWWPAPLSVVVPVGDDLSYLHDGQHSLAVRIPADASLIELITLTGPLLTTSANLPGQPVSETIDDAKRYFGYNVDFYKDSGTVANRQASTIVRVVDDAIEVLRQGAVIINENGRIEK